MSQLAADPTDPAEPAELTMTVRGRYMVLIEILQRFSRQCLLPGEVRDKTLQHVVCIDAISGMGKTTFLDLACSLSDEQWAHLVKLACNGQAVHEDSLFNQMQVADFSTSAALAPAPHEAWLLHCSRVAISFNGGMTIVPELERHLTFTQQVVLRVQYAYVRVCNICGCGLTGRNAQIVRWQFQLSRFLSHGNSSS